MKQLTDAERLEVAMMFLSEHEDLDAYAEVCRKRELGCPDGLCRACTESECKYPDLADPKANGFHNMPVECEDRECRNCTMTQHSRRAIDCPYAENKL